MSGLEVIGTISAVIGVLDASFKIYESVRKDAKLDEAFQTVGRRIPILLDTLKTCKDHLEARKGSLTADVWQALEKIVDACDEKACRLREIFEKCLPGDNEGRQKRYLKVFKRLGKGNKVEELMLSITEDVQLLVNHHAVKVVNLEQQAQLDIIIKEMKSVPSSVPETFSVAPSFHSGGGPQTNNVNSGSGQQINNNAPVGTQNFNSVTKPKEDFSFQETKGICLGQALCIDPALFVGRDAEVKKMQDALKPGEETRKQQRLVLGGMGGIGKTQLAIAYAKHCSQHYTSVFWLNAASEATIKASFRAMADLIYAVQDPTVLDGEQSVIHTRRWLSDPANSRWLLIFDNYDDPEQFDIEPYYPLASHGSIIITTRRPDRVAGEAIRVQPLPNIEASLEILRTRSHRMNISLDPYAKRLAERLGGLPLALATAGAYLHHSSITFERYLQEYERRWNINPQRPTQLQEYRDRTLYTTWGLSYARLECENPSAAKLLGLLAYFDHQSVWYELLSAGLRESSPQWMQEMIADDILFDGLMGILVEYCLIDIQSATWSWTMHSCVHDWTVAVLNHEVDLEQYWYAFDCVAASIDTIDWDQLGYAKYTRLAPHATQLVLDRFRGIDTRCDEEADRLRDCFSIAEFLTQQEQFLPAEQMYIRALCAYEKTRGPTHISTLNTVNNLGLLYSNHGKWNEAEQMYSRALAGYEKELGPAHPSILGTINNLGNLFCEQDKLVDAEHMLYRALDGYNALSPDCKQTLGVLNNLGIVYGVQGKLSEAEQMFLRAISGREKALGPDHKLTLNTISNLGDLYCKQGKLDKAEQMLHRALDGYNALGPDCKRTLGVLDNLGIVYGVQGKLSEAEQMFLRALSGREKALGPDHKLTLNTISNLGNIYRNQGKLDKAEQMLHRALPGKEKAVGRDHTSTLNTVNSLGLLYHKQDKMNEAEQMYLRALAGFEQARGRDHTLTLNVVQYLGYHYRTNHKLAEMIRLTSEWGNKCIYLFGNLGKLLLQASDDTNAQRAFQYQHAHHDGSSVYATCDECDCSITATTGLAVCRRCADVALCQGCFSKHVAGTRTRLSCVGHSFAEIDLQGGLVNQHSDLTELQAPSWLQDLAVRFSQTGSKDSSSEQESIAVVV